MSLYFSPSPLLFLSSSLCWCTCRRYNIRTRLLRIEPIWLLSLHPRPLANTLLQSSLLAPLLHVSELVWSEYSALNTSHPLYYLLGQRPFFPFRTTELLAVRALTNIHILRGLTLWQVSLAMLVLFLSHHWNKITWKSQLSIFEFMWMPLVKLTGTGKN